MPRRNNLWANIDWITVLLFLVLVFLGWINIYAAIYNPESQSIFDISQQYGKQLIWIGAALALGFLILLIEINFYVFCLFLIRSLTPPELTGLALAVAVQNSGISA